MDFFATQSVARRDSRWLIGGFVVALLAMSVVVHAVVTGLSVLFGRSANLAEPNLQSVLLIALVWLTVLFGGYFRWLDVRAGGAALARRFGAEPVLDTDRDPRLRTLSNLAAEMALASNCTPVRLFWLKRERRINAFVVGGGDDVRATMVVTAGALDALDRDELRAVIAHEYGHIAQGDLPLNMRLLIVMGGLAALDEVGTLLIGERPEDQIGYRFHPAMLVGGLLRAFGSIGIGVGGVLRAAVSRQREFLADASAVQYTRHPFALASALSVIRDSQCPEALQSRHMHEIAHLCFQGGLRTAWFRRLLASHPPLQTRIDAIDPHVEVKRRKRNHDNSSSGKELPGGLAEVETIERVGKMSAAMLAMSVGSEIQRTTLGVLKRDKARSTGSSDVEMPDRIALLLLDKVNCLAVLCALFARTDPIERRDYLGGLSFAFDAQLSSRVEGLLDTMSDEFESDRLGLVDHVTTVLRTSIPFDRRQQLMTKLEGLLEAHRALDLHSYATLQLVRRKLGMDFPVLEKLAGHDRDVADGRHIKNFDAMSKEFALLLSLMVDSSGAPQAVLDREFKRVLKCYTSTSLPRRSPDEPGIVAELEEAFQTLYAQPKPIRLAFVQHCVEIMEADGHIARAEKTLLNLFAASLGCEELAA